ncbi:hypothetical protein HanXRQr2_Chr17g0800851 [Helianthus annuus]|uniref:Uncharacterized protein n=1 Tax=Helianthus annuus TaxID=4232 RepID=A0A9K3DJJ7_HELAN|nr:hypothetical protein HanXRQr2_Chr17g0800851 [Helianthus annuus]KAJ0901241.1 hypothetical protein HanPSC8_Chr08g0323081 [Helianthus annuus]
MMLECRIKETLTSGSLHVHPVSITRHFCVSRGTKSFWHKVCI